MASRGHRLRTIVLGAVVLVVIAVAGPFIYIHFVEGPAPAKLSLPKSASSSVTTAVPSGGGSSHAGTLEGTWNVGPGSIVGYRVQEVLLGQRATAVGRTSRVSGSVAVTGTTVAGISVEQGTFTVDMADVKSDQSERNGQFDGRIMDVSAYPTAKLVLVGPIALGDLSTDGVVQRYPATGDLTLHGVTKKVSFTVSAKRSGGEVYVLADIPILFADWGIANPSVGGFVTTQSSGTLEVLLYLSRGAGNAPVTSSSSPVPTSPGGGGPVTVPSTTVPPLKVPG